MKLNYRSLFSVLSAVGIAAAGIASSAEAYTRSVAITTIPASGQLQYATVPVTWQDRTPNTGYNMGIGGMTYNYNNVAGQDQLVAIAGASNNSAVNVGKASWTCRSTLWWGPFTMKRTTLATGTKTTASSAFAEGTSAPVYTFGRLPASSLQTDCT